MTIPIYQVDAFTSRVLAGNPAAVCPLPAWLTDGRMQAIAAENNLSETAYLVKRGARYDLRWFTPAVEVDLCGHATLAAAFVVFEFLEPGRREVMFDTRSGTLSVRRDDDWLFMDFPCLPPEPCAADLRPAIGLTPRAVLRGGMYLLALLDTEAQVRELKPDMAALMHIERPGLIVTAPGDEVDFVSRVFGPQVGIPEDPVTGSAHCVLTPYWAARLGRQTLRARQVSARGGEIHCALMGERVGLAGQAVLYLRGEIHPPME